MRADVVVVGAGAAGCVVAARLSERRGRSVVLMEAGPDRVLTASMSFLDGMRAPGRTWPDLTAVRALGQEARPYVRGRGVGGSAAINAMVAMVGEPDDYDEWERVYGCLGWSWRDVRPWFRRVALPMRRPRRRELGPLSTAMVSSVPGAERARLTRAADGRRASVSEIYLERARPRDNLHVRPDSLVDRLLFDGRRAVGVCLADGEVVEAGMVVVCAGAVHTPAVLLRSAVDREGIGRGLHDHPSVLVPMTMRDLPSKAATLPISVVARASHSVSNDLQVIPINSTETASLMGAAMRVHSRGQVRLAALDATTDPIIEFNMFADERDLDLLRAAAQQLVQIAATSAVAAVAVVGETAATDEWLRAAGGEYVHAAGSCRMGGADDPLAVVDSRCRVIGYQSLVVCDASVMPNLPRANPCLPTVMIAERISAIIDADLRDE